MVESLPEGAKSGQELFESSKASTETELGPQVIDLTDDSKVPVTNLVEGEKADWMVEHARKCEVFNKWCKDNGVR